MAALILLAAGTLQASGAGADAPASGGPGVAVLVEPTLPPYGAQPTLVPEQIVPMLVAQGIPAVAVSVADLTRPGALTVQHYAALIMPYGNAYPAVALSDLQAFHQAAVTARRWSATITCPTCA